MNGKRQPARASVARGFAFRPQKIYGDRALPTLDLAAGDEVERDEREEE